LSNKWLFEVKTLTESEIIPEINCHKIIDTAMKGNISDRVVLNNADQINAIIEIDNPVDRVTQSLPIRERAYLRRKSPEPIN
jgi:hypothetical protein